MRTIKNIHRISRISYLLLIALSALICLPAQGYDAHTFTNLFHSLEYGTTMNKTTRTQVDEARSWLESLVIPNARTNKNGSTSPGPAYGTELWNTNWPILKTVADKITPTPENLFPRDDSGKYQMAIGLLLWENNNVLHVPLDELFVHRTAELYVSEAPRVTKTVTIKVPPKPRGSWNLDLVTGLYANPGEVITITSPHANVEDKNITIKINHQNKNDSLKKMMRMQYVQKTYTLKNSMQCGSVFGGLIMVQIPSGLNWSEITLTVENATEVPHFKRDLMSSEDWLSSDNRMRDCYWGITSSPNCEFIMTAKQLRKLTHINEHITFYDEITQLCREIYGSNSQRPYREHVIFHAASGNSSDPQNRGYVNLHRTFKDLVHRGDFLMFHEYCHPLDDKVVLPGFDEWMNNVAPIFCSRLTYGFSSQGNGYPRERIAQFNDNVKNNPEFMHTGNRSLGFAKMLFLTSLGEHFGWYTYRDVMRKIISHKGDKINDRKLNIYDRWLISFGEITGYDLSPMFKTWQWPYAEDGIDAIHPDAEAAVSHLPKFSAVEIVQSSLITRKNTPITFEDPSKYAYSYDGTLTNLVVSQPTNGVVVANQDGTFTYTPDPEFLGQETIPFSIENGLGNRFDSDLLVSVLKDEDFPQIESGDAEASTDEWTTVQLANEYDSMVVVAQPVVNTNNLLPVVTRIRNAESGSSFELKLQYAGTNAPTATTLPVQYMVVEEGVYSNDVHGIKMEAVKLVSDVASYTNDWISTPYETVHQWYDHYQHPIMFGQVMTHNDSRWSTFWSAKNSLTSFVVGKHIGQDSDRTRNPETLGFIIFNTQNQRPNTQVGQLQLACREPKIAGFGELALTETAHKPFKFMGPLHNIIIQASNKSENPNIAPHWAALTSEPNSISNTVSSILIRDKFDEREIKGLHEGIVGFSKIPVPEGPAQTLAETTVVLHPIKTEDKGFTIISADSGGNGTVSVTAGGNKLHYRPDSNQSEPVEITYTISDGQQQLQRTITVNVVPEISTEDSDSDRMTDYQEFIAGSDPNNPKSRFEANTEVLEGGISIQWDSVPERKYKVLYSHDLETPFTNIAEELTFPQGSYTDRTERVENSGFYKVKAELK